MAVIMNVLSSFCGAESYHEATQPKALAAGEIEENDCRVSMRLVDGGLRVFQVPIVSAHHDTNMTR
jgi:hypothetical protein